MKIILYWRELTVIARCEHKIFLGREFRQDIEKGNFAHVQLVNAKRAIEKAFLDPVLESTESFSSIELATRNVSAGAANSLDYLKAPFQDPRLSCSRGAEQEEVPLFCTEIQSLLQDVALPLSKDLDGFCEVRGSTFLLFEENSWIVLDGAVAVESSEDLSLAFNTFQETGAVERQPAFGDVQRITFQIHQGLFGFLRNMRTGRKNDCICPE